MLICEALRCGRWQQDSATGSAGKHESLTHLTYFWPWGFQHFNKSLPSHQMWEHTPLIPGIDRQISVGSRLSWSTQQLQTSQWYIVRLCLKKYHSWGDRCAQSLGYVNIRTPIVIVPWSSQKFLHWEWKKGTRKWKHPLQLGMNLWIIYYAISSIWKVEPKKPEKGKCPLFSRNAFQLLWQWGPEEGCLDAASKPQALPSYLKKGFVGSAPWASGSCHHGQGFFRVTGS